MYFFNRRHLDLLFCSSYNPKFTKHMITGQDVFCLRNNVLAMLYQRLYEVLFQDNLNNNNNTCSWGDFCQLTGRNN